MNNDTTYDPNALRFGNCIAFTPEVVREEVAAWLDSNAVHVVRNMVQDPDTYDAMHWAEQDATDEELETIAQRAIQHDALWLAFVTAITDEITFFYSTEVKDEQ
jgi:hypothetical protein